MGWKNIKISEEKSLKAPFAIYLDLECLLKKSNLVKIIIIIVIIIVVVVIIIIKQYLIV